MGSRHKNPSKLLFIRELDLPSLPVALHQNRVLHLARKYSKLSAQPLLKIASKKRRIIPEEYLPHITPLGWEHINLIGQYSFTHQSGRSLDNLRPLRLPEQEEQAEREPAQTIAPDASTV